MSPLIGGCLCAAVRFEVSRPLQAAGHCHCSICRKAHGAAFATWAFVDPQHFRWTAGEELTSGYESSPNHVRRFCSRCGAPLVATHNGQVTEVVLASIDGDPGVRPSEHIFVTCRAPWHEITDGLPQSAGWPPGMQP